MITFSELSIMRVFAGGAPQLSSARVARTRPSLREAKLELARRQWNGCRAIIAQSPKVARSTGALERGRSGHEDLLYSVIKDCSRRICSGKRSARLRKLRWSAPMSPGTPDA